MPRVPLAPVTPMRGPETNGAMEAAASMAPFDRAQGALLQKSRGRGAPPASNHGLPMKSSLPISVPTWRRIE
jgi:hypothetical protein